MDLSIPIAPGQAVDLARLPTRLALEKADVEDQLAKLRSRLEDAHELLWSQGQSSVLVLLQGLDSAGKDRVIRRVFTALLPQALEVHGFGPPSPDEAAHDFLWRYHQRVPAAGRVGVFNRTWYESVLIERVDHLVPATTIDLRFTHIDAFERLLADRGTHLLKVFLHVSKEEQAKRLDERRTTPGKHWKHNPDDQRKHGQYAAYMDAYQDVLRRSSTAAAPWHVVPSDHKPTRDLAVARLLLATLGSAAKPGPP